MSKDRDAKIVAMRKAGASYKQISNELDIAPQLVYQALFRAGMTRKGRGGKAGSAPVTEEVKKRIIELRRKGEVYLAIAQELNVSTAVVYKTLKAEGLTTTRATAEPELVMETESDGDDVEQELNDSDSEEYTEEDLERELAEEA